MHVQHFVSDYHLPVLKHWRQTHRLNVCSAILISGSYLLKHWRATHNLDKYSVVHISDSDLLTNKYWRATHKLEA